MKSHIDALRTSATRIEEVLEKYDRWLEEKEKYEKYKKKVSFKYMKTYSRNEVFLKTSIELRGLFSRVLNLRSATIHNQLKYLFGE